MTRDRQRRPARAAALCGGLALALAPLPAAAIPVHWIASVDGNWSTVANWDSGFLPRPQDDVIIDAPGSYRVTLGTSVSVKSVAVGGSGATPTLVIAATGTPGTMLTTSLGLQNLGAIELVGLSYYAATLKATGGSIVNAPGSSITSLRGLNSSSSNLLVGTVLNQGVISVSYYLVLQGATFQNDPGGVLSLVATTGLYNGSGIGSTHFINDGTIAVQPGAEFQLMNCTFSGTGVLSGGGTASLGGSALALAHWPTVASLGVGSCTQVGSVAIPVGTVSSISNCTLQGDLDIAGQLLEEAVTVNGVVHVLPGGEIQQKSREFVARDGLINEGRIRLTPYGGTTLRLPGGVFENRVGGLFEVTLPNLAVAVLLEGDLRNAGTMNFDRPATLSFPLGSQPGNSGLILVRGGPLTLQMPPTQVFRNQGTLDVRNNLVLEGGQLSNEASGVIAGVGAILPAADGFVNAGTIRPGVMPGTGRLTIYGSTICTPTSLIDLEIGGAAWYQYDAIGFEQVTLDGHLNLGLVNGYLPTAGSSFPLLDWVGHTGTFTQLTGLDPGTGIHFEPVPAYPAFGESGVAFLAVAGGASGVATGPPTSDPEGAPRFVGAWPNPARAAFEFGVMVPRAREVDLAVFDVAGRRVRALRQGAAAPGEERVTWDGRDDAGRALAAGVYLVRLAADGVVERRHVTWLP